MKRLLFAAAALLVLEAGLSGAYKVLVGRLDRIPVLYETVYWPVPPWLKAATIIRRDGSLGPWMKPNAERRYLNLFGPIGRLEDVDVLFNRLGADMPDWARSRPVWELRTNSLGLRDRELPALRPEGTFRVVVMGDSWTVGVNVDEKDAFPRRLEALLRERRPGKPVEVVNYGSIGASAEIGRRRLPARVLALKPDLVIAAYAQNDEYKFHAAPESRLDRLRRAAGSACGLSQVCRLLSYAVKPRGGIASALQGILFNPWTAAENAPPQACERGELRTSAYYRDMDALAREAGARGVPLMLLYNNVPEGKHCTLAVLEILARERGLPLLDASALLRRETLRLEARAEREAGLAGGARPRAPKDSVEAVFRVDRRGPDAARPVFIMGGEAALGSFVPGTIPMFDDGTHGDQKARDGIWSLAARFKPESEAVYLYTAGGSPGRWEGLENYWPRKFRFYAADAGRRVYLPVQKFGEQVLHSDPFHPSSAGHELIARALAEAVSREPAFKRFTDAR